jgi:hypothetical protein
LQAAERPEARLIRQVTRANREIGMTLDVLSELCEEIQVAPVVAAEPAAADYSSRSNIALTDILKMAKLALETNPSVFGREIGPILGAVTTSLVAFKGSITEISVTKEERDELLELLAKLLAVIETAKTPGELTTALPNKAFGLAADLRDAIAHALSTEVVPQPKATALLPFRFAVGHMDIKPAPVNELHAELGKETAACAASLQKFVASLSNPKTSPEVILANLN